MDDWKQFSTMAFILKTGLALFTGEMFRFNYAVSSTDTAFQTNNVDGVNWLYGKSTNKIVEQVLYDLLNVT